MKSKIRIFGHPAHQAFVVIPAGLLIGSAGFDAFALIASTPASYHLTAHHMLAAGLVTGLMAAPVGTLDWLSIPSGTRAKRIGMFHACANVLALLVFGMSWFLRRNAPETPSLVAVGLSFFALGSLSLAAWFGGELVSRLGVGVSDSANLNATSSLSDHA